MLLMNLKYATRNLVKNRMMAITAIASLALGIGANVALFTVVNAVLIRPMNYPHPERVVELTRSWHGRTYSPSVTPLKFDSWKRENHSFEAMAAFNYGSLGVNFTGSSDPERLSSLPVSAGFFRVLGVHPVIGRTFTDAEDKPGAGRFAIISYSLWKRLFRSDPDIVGKAISLDNANYTVVGVMPADFEFPVSADLWSPLQLKADPADHANDYSIIARLKSGVSLAQAAEDMHLVAAHFRQQYGGGIMMGDGEDITVHDFHKFVVGDTGPALLVLTGAVGFVLLIVCANVANLLLARSAVRQNEMAVRTALGASGWNLMSLLFTESILLSLAGGIAGVILAQFCVPLLVSLAPGNLLHADQIGVNWSVIFFAAIVTLAAALVFGLFPALESVRLGIADRLRGTGTRTATQSSGSSARKVLVVLEVAVSLVLLTGAGLLLQTFHNLSSVNPGFDAHSVLTTQMSVSAEQFRTTAATSLLEKHVETRLESIPGVLAAATISSLPTEPGFDDPFEIIGRPTTETLDCSFRAISPHYFAAMQVPLISGRTFTEQDSRQSRRVIIVNQAFAKKYFPHESALGQQLLIGRIMGPAFADVPRQIVGIVGDTHDTGLADPADPTYFEPLAQLPDALTALGNQLIPLNWVIRTSIDPMALMPRIRRETLTASGGVPMAEPRPLEQVVGDSIARQRFSMTLLTVFAGLAVLLCAIGLYGVISYSAAQRTRELGIRAALGAAQRDLLKLVLGQGIWLIGTGLLTGLLATFGLTHLLQGMLFGVTPFDPLTLLSVTALLGFIALSACWLPAYRAARVDAAIVLREN